MQIQCCKWRHLLHSFVILKKILSIKGQKRHLLAHGWFTAAVGPVRLQAQAERVEQQAVPEGVHRGAAAAVHQGASQTAGLAAYVQAARAERPVDQ